MSAPGSSATRATGWMTLTPASARAVLYSTEIRTAPRASPVTTPSGETDATAGSVDDQRAVAGLIGSTPPSAASK